MGGGGFSSEAGWEVLEEGGGLVVCYVCLFRLVSDGLFTCEVEEIVEGAGVTVGGGRRDTIHFSSRGEDLELVKTSSGDIPLYM